MAQWEDLVHWDGVVYNDRYGRVYKTSQLNIEGVRYNTHRVLWYLVHGEWPDGELIFINGDKTDIRIDNLQLVKRGARGPRRKYQYTD